MVCSKSFVLSFFLYILFFSCVFSNPSYPLFFDGGVPFFTHYSGKTYQAHIQNWCINQDDKGMIYVGNTQGLLTFDGQSWELFPSPNKTVIRSLEKDPNGTLFYGAKNDFGYLAADTAGQLQLISLRKHLTEKIKDLDDIWEIRYHNQAIYFQSLTHIVILRDPHLLPSSRDEIQIETWYAGNEIEALSHVGDELWFWRKGKGIMKWEDDTAKLVAGSEFLDRTMVYKMLPFFEDSSRQLIFTYSKGVYLRDGTTYTKLGGELGQHLSITGNHVQDVFPISKDILGIGTTTSGVIFLNPQGEVLASISEDNWLPEEKIHSGFMDHHGSLWLATDNGITHIELQAPFAKINGESGLKGRVISATKGNEQVYLGTDNGIYVSGKDFKAPFKKIDGADSHAFSVLYTQNQLLAAFPYLGIYQLRNGHLQKLYEKTPIILTPSRYDDRIVFVGGGAFAFGFCILYWDGSNWNRFLTDPIIKDEIRYVVEERKGVVWLGSRSKGFIRVELDQLRQENMLGKLAQGDSLRSRTQRVTEEQATSRFRARPFFIGDRIYFASNQGLKSIDSSGTNWTLKPDSSLGESLAQADININLLSQGHDKEIWVHSSSGKDNQIVRLIPGLDGSYQWQDIPSMERAYKVTITGAADQPSQLNKMIIFTTEGVLKYDTSVRDHQSGKFSTLIRKVKVKHDSTIFLGSTFAELPDIGDHLLAFNNNEIRFEYSAPIYDEPGKIQYQVLLEGNDDSWSNWSLETKKDYTNLAEGEYTFRVRSKNIYGHIGEEATFTLSILPPWYRTWWAYLILSILGFGLIYSLIKWRIHRLKKQTKELAELVQERTQEVLTQKNQLAKQAKRLQELDQVKSQFFTNISHELRTPLTVIRGMSEQIQKDPGRWLDQGIPLIQRNTGQLLDLVEQILDLRKLESGKLSLNFKQLDVVQFIQYIIESFQSLAESKGIFLSFSAQVQDPLMDIDKDKFLRIISNLLSNAIKFTPKGGRIKIRMRQEGQQLLIQVSDTGMGIPEHQVEHIFERFYQVDDSDTRQGEGTGIGLALVAELVKLLGGGIEVQSEIGKGSTFQLFLPIYQNAPLADQENKSRESLAFPIVQSHPSEPISPRENNGQLPSLLIVEDNEDVVQYISTFLQDHYQIQLAQDGEEGIEKALERIPDLIISDIMMPRKNGFDLCHSLKQHEFTSHIPIILLTAKADVDSRIHGWKSGADAYLAKPFNEEELLAVLEKSLELRTRMQARYASPGPLPESSDPAVQVEDAFISKVKQIIWDNLEDEDFKVPALCKELGLGRTQLHNKIKALTGRSTSLYVRLIRLNKAKELLLSTDMHVSEVSYAVGYSNPSYFSRIFEEEFGVRPSKIIA